MCPNVPGATLPASVPRMPTESTADHQTIIKALILSAPTPDQASRPGGEAGFISGLCSHDGEAKRGMEVRREMVG